MNVWAGTGNLTRDPEMKYTNNQVAVTSFGIAVNEKWKDKAGNAQEEVCYVECNAWERTAEIVSQFCKKGSKVGIVGKLKFNEWTAQDGGKRSKLTVTVKQLELLGGAPDSAPGHHGHYQSGQHMPLPEQGQQQNQPSQHQDGAPPQGQYIDPDSAPF